MHTGRHWPMLIARSGIRNQREQLWICEIVGRRTLQLSVRRIPGPVREGPGQIDIPDNIIGCNQVSRCSWLTGFTGKVCCISITPWRGRFLRVQRPHTHIITACINALNGESLCAGDRNINPVTIILTPLRHVSNGAIHFAP